MNKNYGVYKIISLRRTDEPLMSIILATEIFPIKKLFMVLKRLFGNVHVAAVKRLIHSEKPDLVIVADDSGICTSVVKICKVKNIPVICLQVGVLTRNKRKNFLSLLRKRRYVLWTSFSRIMDNYFVLRILLCLNFRFPSLEWGLSNPDRLGVMGQYFYNLLIERGVPSDHISIVGHVLFEEPSSVGGKTTPLSRKFPKVLLFTQPFIEDNFVSEDQYVKVLKEIVRALSKIENLCLTIKLHPRETETKYRFLYESKDCMPYKLNILKDSNLKSLCMNCDLVLVFSSTTGLIAKFLGKPVMVLDFFDLPYYNINKLYGIIVNDFKEVEYISRVILEKGSSILEDRTSHNNIRYFIRYVGLSAKKKILKLVAQTLKEHQI